MTYSDELRVDSAKVVIPVVSTLFIIFPLMGIALRIHTQSQNWLHFLIASILSLLGAGYAWPRVQEEKESSLKASAHYLAVHMIALAFILNREWPSGSFLPYFFILFTVLFSMLLLPYYGFFAWLASSGLILLSVGLTGDISWSAVMELLIPIFLNLLVAGLMFISAMEWQRAVESVSLLHRRAQNRRDELFAMKEEVQATNDRLKFLNKKLDEARQAALKERDIRTRFMNNVSHELRTPLNGIVNFAHILAEGGVGSVNQRQIDYLQRIEKSGWHLLDVLNDLLDMAQIESGEFKLYIEPVDLEEICWEAIRSVKGLVLEKPGLELIPDFPDKWPQVEADNMRLKQALINLLGNAAKYTEEGHIALRVRREEDQVLLMVEDTGVGIAPKYHEAIFQEFRQIDETAARRRIGTGLGLPLTRHLVERHGGVLTVESDVGQGSTFTITLPAYRGEKGTEEDASPALPAPISQSETAL